MDITETLHAPDRAAWRTWLETHSANKAEIWLIRDSTKPSVPYLDSVEEALCFGWIDGIAKRLDDARLAQRFTPRRPRSHWTELNRERARRLIAEGRMTAAGRAVLPDLSTEHFQVAPDIQAALQTDPQTWANFQAFPALYQRIRVGYIEEARRQPEVFTARLNNFVSKTRANKQFGGMR
ncbi:hypothetical protein GO986_01135 [Deinococcus sp. HMF7620]|uniref:Bacteriocin-protection protein n=1 Tax=Deinococcus arboris TaxID=2682977 RepID=A0A7C9HVL7_9DEIO|nr:YdeI/OmpD-associated family protein [Deinococcus arboris]MVN85370.1 hypothetical protein [Deinococcus arboris]